MEFLAHLDLEEQNKTFLKATIHYGWIKKQFFSEHSGQI